MPDSITRLAPAKLNLALHVTGRRDDGYHLIESLVVFADFGDRVTVLPAETDEFVVTGHYAPMVPINEGNLVLAARDMLRDHFTDLELGHVRIALEKNLPVASGVGGGSSDAAATLKALSAYWGIEPDLDEIAANALSLGADIPMCIAAQPLVAGGIGDELKPLGRFPAIKAVLVNPGQPVSTPAVFGALEKRDNAPLACPPEATDAVALGDYLAGTRNDLQLAAIALCPLIGDVLESLTAEGAIFARMSGSGATCFGLFDNPGPAAAAADRIAKQQPGWFVETCTIMGTEDDGRN